MSLIRLTHALAETPFTVPETGTILLARMEAEVAPAFDGAALHVWHGSFPAAEGWSRAGVPEQGSVGADHAAAIVGLPKAKDFARWLVGQAMVATLPGGWIAVDGPKTHGTDPMLKALRGAGLEVFVTSKAHGKTIAFLRPETIPDAVLGWSTLAPTAPEGWQSALAAFSSEKIDRGSQLLVDHLPALSGLVCDLGAGWGFIGAEALRRGPKIQRLDLVEAERDALDAARLNIADARAGFHWADARHFDPGARYDAILTNPPFHDGRAATPALGQDFIRAAARLVAPRGRLLLVANRHLPYEPVLAERFGTVEVLVQDSAFKLFQATRPNK